MRFSLITILFLSTFNLSAQELDIPINRTIIDTIRICNDTICHLINRGDTRMGHIGINLFRNKDFDKYYKKNIKKCIRHGINLIEFRSAFTKINSQEEFEQKSRFERKNIIRNIVRDNSKVFKEANFLLNLIEATDSNCNKDSLRKKLEVIDDFRAVSFLLNGFDSYYHKSLAEHYQKKSLPNSPYLHGLEQNRKTITDYVSFLLHKDYLNYSQEISSPQLIKGTTVMTDNDVFIPIPKLNDDKYYTGGVRFEVQTDFLKLNFLQNSFSKKYRWLSYQGLFWGMEVYTPNIRYKSEDDTNSKEEYTLRERLDFYNQDRPFASYQYLGVTNYRMHYLGHKRVKTQYRFGIIGGGLSERIQNTLHRDQTISSVRVIGWENQIGHPGRFGFNFDIQQDWMLQSSGFDIFDFNKEKLARLRVKAEAKASEYEFAVAKNKDNADVLKRKKERLADILRIYEASKEERIMNSNREKRCPRVHIYSSAGLNIGNFLTAAEGSIGFSNLNFKETDGNHNFKVQPDRTTQAHFTANIGMRYVFHNPALEGFGFGKVAKYDPTENLEPDYVIDRKHVNPLVGFAKLKFGIRVQQTTFFYQLLLHTREVKNIGSGFIYGWGTIGMHYSNISLFGEN